MSKKNYQLHLKGYVGGYDLDRDYVPFGITVFFKVGITFGITLSNYVHFLPSCHPLAQTQIQHIFAAFLSYTQSKKLLIFSELR